MILPAAKGSYARLLELNNYKSVTYLMSLLGDSFTGQYNGKDLQTFLIKCLDFRHDFSEVDSVNVVEPAVISCIVSMVLKMNEKEFNMFYKLITGWVALTANKSDRLQLRSVSFYKYVLIIS